MKELSNKTKEYLKNVEDRVNEQFKDAECVTTEQIKEAVYKELGLENKFKSCSTCNHDGELVCATHGCHNKERYEAK